MNEIERLKSIDVNGDIKKALVEQEKSKSLEEIERAITTLKGLDHDTCIKGVIDWLKQPAKEEHNETDRC